jgi:hypothetical protein
LVKAGALVLTTGDRDALADRMLELGVEEPGQLLEAAERWGLVEIREEQNPDWQGG